MLFKRIQRLVAAGKWKIIGGWYLQPDCNVPSGDFNCRQNTEWLQLAAKGVYKPVDIILGNESELHIDHIFLNTERVEVVDYKFLNDRIVLDDGEHRYSDHDPAVVTVKIRR